MRCQNQPRFIGIALRLYIKIHIIVEIDKLNFRNTMQKLLDLGFTPSANVTRENGQLKIIINENRFSRNILYAFIVARGNDQSEWLVRYIGHSRKTFENRMYGYQQGNGRGVNNRIYRELNDRYSQGENVQVYCLPDIFNMELHELSLDVAAGLEYALIDYYRNYNLENGHPPLQNIAGNINYVSQEPAHLQELEQEEANEENNQYIQAVSTVSPYQVLGTFNQTLSKTYWDGPYINIPKNLSGLFGQHGETAVITIVNGELIEQQFSALVNRNAVANGAPRFYIPGADGRLFQAWKRQHFEIGDNIEMKIIGENQILIQSPTE